MKRAIILMAYGSPERAEDVEPYYTHIRGGRKPSSSEVENLTERYKMIGGKSQLLSITNSASKKLEQKLGGMKVYAGMKHWHPYIAEVFEQISSDGVTDLLSIALAPHYSRMSIGSYQDAVNKANLDHGGRVKIKSVNEWYLDPVFLDKWAQRISAAIEEKFRGTPRKDISFLFTAHSLPERIQTWGDPYKLQLLETMERLAAKLGLEKDQYGFGFQSAGHSSEPWLGPDILDKIKEIDKQGWRNILVAPIGFVSDHLEILFDIDIEAKNLSGELGLHLERTDSFNDSDDFIEVLESVVKSNWF